MIFIRITTQQVFRHPGIHVIWPSPTKRDFTNLMTALKIRHRVAEGQVTASESPDRQCHSEEPQQSHYTFPDWQKQQQQQCN